MNESVSPEEKLFKIIQQEKTSPSKPKVRALARWREKLVPWVKGLVRKTGFSFPGKINEIRLRTVNIILAILLAIIVISGAYYTIARYPTMAKILSAVARENGFFPEAKEETEELHPLSYYADDARQRDIFNGVQASAGQGVESVTPVAASSKGSGASGLKLQGIAWSDVPKALIQSGDKDGKLYILKQGQMVGATGYSVKTILRNKVILTAGGKDIEL